MKKFLIYSAAVVGVLALLAHVGTAFFLGSIVTSGVNRVGSNGEEDRRDHQRAPRR